MAYTFIRFGRWGRDQKCKVNTGYAREHEARLGCVRPYLYKPKDYPMVW